MRVPQCSPPRLSTLRVIVRLSCLDPPIRLHAGPDKPTVQAVVVRRNVTQVRLQIRVLRATPRTNLAPGRTDEGLVRSHRLAPRRAFPDQVLEPTSIDCDQKLAKPIQLSTTQRQSTQSYFELLVQTLRLVFNGELHSGSE